MIINDPVALAQVTAAVDAYETALMTNDVEALDGAFWNAPHTVRLGVAENLYGFDQIAAFRVGRAGSGVAARSSTRKSASLPAARLPIRSPRSRARAPPRVALSLIHI